MGNAKLFILTNEANEKLLKYETTLVDSRRLLHEIKYKLIMKKDKGRKMKSTLVQKYEDMEKMIGTHHREISAPLNELYDLLIEVVYMKKKFHEKEDEFQHVMLQQKQKIQQSDQQIHRLQERKLLYEKQVKSLATALQIKNKAEIMLKKQLKTTRAAKSERVRNILPEIQYSTLVQKEEQISLFFMMAGQLLNKLTEENISEKRKETLINKVKKLEKKLNILEKQGDKYKQLINNVNINIKGRWIYVFWKKWNAHFKKEYEEKFQQLNVVIADFQDHLKDYQRSFEEMYQNIHEYENKEGEMRKHIDQLHDTFKSFKQLESGYKAEIQQIKEVLTAYKEKEAYYETKRNEMEDTIKKYEENEQNFKRELEQKEKIIHQLKKRNREPLRSNEHKRPFRQTSNEKNLDFKNHYSFPVQGQSQMIMFDPFKYLNKP